MTKPRSTSPLRTRNSAATQRALLASGARLFAERGYEAATTEQLAEAAGVTKAMVRYHFEDKAGLYRAVIAESLDHVMAAVAAVRDADLAPQDKLSRYVAALAGAISARPHIGGLLISDYAAGRIAKDKALMASLMRLSLTTKAILDQGRRAGAFRNVDYHLFHLWLVGAITFFVSSQRFRDDLAAAPPWSGPAPSLPRFVKLLQHLAVSGVAGEA